MSARNDFAFYQRPEDLNFGVQISDYQGFDYIDVGFDMPFSDDSSDMIVEDSFDELDERIDVEIGKNLNQSEIQGGRPASTCVVRLDRSEAAEKMATKNSSSSQSQVRSRKRSSDKSAVTSAEVQSIVHQEVRKSTKSLKADFDRLEKRLDDGELQVTNALHRVQNNETEGKKNSEKIGVLETRIDGLLNRIKILESENETLRDSQDVLLKIKSGDLSIDADGVLERIARIEKRVDFLEIEVDRIDSSTRANSVLLVEVAVVDARYFVDNMVFTLGLPVNVVDAFFVGLPNRQRRAVKVTFSCPGEKSVFLKACETDRFKRFYALVTVKPDQTLLRRVGFSRMRCFLGSLGRGETTRFSIRQSANWCQIDGKRFEFHHFLDEEIELPSGACYKIDKICEKNRDFVVARNLQCFFKGKFFRGYFEKRKNRGQGASRNWNSREANRNGVVPFLGDVTVHPGANDWSNPPNFLTAAHGSSDSSSISNGSSWRTLSSQNPTAVQPNTQQQGRRPPLLADPVGNIQ